MSINLREIARIAKVSPTTVSLVLNGRKGVSEEKRKDIQRILDDHSYKKRLVNPKMRAQRIIYIIRYCIDNLHNYNNYELDSHIINCLHKVCHEMGHQVSMIICNVGNFEDTIKSLELTRNCGVVLIASMLSNEQIQWLDRSDIISIPFVCIDNYMMHTHLCSVSPDNYNISCMIMNYLNSLNVKTVGYLCEENRTPKLNDRERGFYQSAEQLGMIAEKPVTLRMTLKDASEDLQRQFLTCDHLPEVYYAETSAVAVIAVNILRKIGKRIPEDVGIVSGDNTFIGVMTSPSITAVSISYKDICRIAVNLIDMQINNEDISSSAEHICVSGCLIKGGSTLPLITG